MLHIGQYKGSVLQAERRLLVDLSEELLKADCWLTWFGTYFDIPFLNTRLLYHGLPVLPPNFKHIDGWKTSKNRLRLGNNRLNSVQQFLNLDAKKTHLKGEYWILAMTGDKQAMKYIVDHCYQDVLVLEQAYERLRPLIVDHPHRGLIDGNGGCSVCGSTKIQRRGHAITKTRKYERFQCQNCGKWLQGTKPVAVAPRA